MKMTVTHPEYGDIRLDWSFWTGKYTLYCNENELPKTGKTTFEYIDPENGEPINITVSGNLFTGFCLVIKIEVIRMSSSPK